MTVTGFPDNFVWGTATSAYQIEGGWNADGKGESIWDRFTHRPFTIPNGETGDVACDHYHRLPEDVALLKTLGVQSYRFSTAWSRVLPQGTGKPNPAGLAFYDRLVDSLLEAGIDPLVTLYHWDLPQALQERGGWANRDSAEWFAEYARLMFDRLGDRVRGWVTHNEPWVVSFLGHFYAMMAPGLADASLAYRVAHHLLLSHGKALQVFRQGSYPGEIGIALDMEHTYPATDSEADHAARQRYTDNYYGLFAGPVFLGEYPPVLMEWLHQMGPQMALPVQSGDMDLIHQPVDFLGVNYYRTVSVQFDALGGPLKVRPTRQTMPLWGFTEMGWGVYPDGLAPILLEFQQKYNPPALYITENGCAAPDIPDEQGYVKDLPRIHYIQAHLLSAHAAIQAGVRLRGYYVWSLMDNFEWMNGYAPRFGLVRIDYDTCRRIPKQSFHWYSRVIAQNGLDV